MPQVSSPRFLEAVSLCRPGWSWTCYVA
jgi:hypothetical protein